jgi:hypothetical protein
MMASSGRISSSPGDRDKHAAGECAKVGIEVKINYGDPRDHREFEKPCFVRGRHDYDCRQNRNPNAKDTPEACVERRLAGGPEWLEPGAEPWRKPDPAPTPPPPTPTTSASAPQNDTPAAETDAADEQAGEEEEEVADDEAGDDESGDEDTGSEESGDEVTGSEESGGEESGEEDVGDEEAGDGEMSSGRL